MRDIVRSKIERELVRVKIHDGNAFWNEIGVNAGVSKLMMLSLNLLLPVLVYAGRHSLTANRHKLMLLSLNLLLPVLVYAGRHSLTANRHKLMLLGITSYYWATAKVKTVNEERQIQALVDKKRVIITETSIRSDLKLEDAGGIDCLPTATHELVKGSKTKAKGSSKRTGDELEFDKSKKQKIDEHVEAKKDYDQEEAEMKNHIEIVKDDKVEIDAIPLATKPLMIV
ncbi:hypothetical protein Tco_1497836 [Tanacetum coccineum]